MNCADPASRSAKTGTDTEEAPDQSPLERGAAGASAEREYQRRRDARESQAKTTWGRLAGVYLAVSNEPQSTRAWARGSAGEKLLGAALEQLHDEERVVVLHDRRIPGTRANIDHIAITRAGGVWAIDAKNYQGKVQRIDKGGLLRVDDRLYVGRRECTKLVAGMAHQKDAIQTALGEALIAEFSVEAKAAICFVNAQWSFFARPFTIDGVWVGWGKALAERLTGPGELEPAHLMVLSERVAKALPPA